MPDTLEISSEEVAAYEPLVYSVGMRYSGLDDVELDDLLQEGRIAVWHTLQRGSLPSELQVGDACRKWVRKCRRRGLSGFPDEEGDG